MFVRKSPRHAFIALLAAALTLAACNVGAAPSPTLDVNAINTAIVGTTVAQFSAQFTQTALAVPSATSTSLPTNTPQSLPTFALPTGTAIGLPTISFNTTPIVGAATPLPGFTQIVPSNPTQSLGDSCNNSAFVEDVTIPDGTVLKGGEDFVKVWRIRNTGSCTWDEGFSLVYIGGSSPNLDPYNFDIQNSNDFVAGGATKDFALTLTTPCTIGKYEGTWKMQSDSGYFFGTPLSVYVEVKEKGSNCK